MNDCMIDCAINMNISSCDEFIYMHLVFKLYLVRIFSSTFSVEQFQLPAVEINLLSRTSGGFDLFMFGVKKSNIFRNVGVRGTKMPQTQIAQHLWGI